MDKAKATEAEVQQALDLLRPPSVIAAVTLSGPSAPSTSHIRVRRTGQQVGDRTRYQFWWEARVVASRSRQEWTGAQPYATAEAAYQAAVEAVQGAVSGPMSAPTSGDGV